MVSSLGPHPRNDGSNPFRSTKLAVACKISAAVQVVGFEPLLLNKRLFGDGRQQQLSLQLLTK